MYPITKDAIIHQLSNMKLVEGNIVKVVDNVDVNLQVVSIEKDRIYLRFVDVSLIDREVVA